MPSMLQRSEFLHRADRSRSETDPELTTQSDNVDCIAAYRSRKDILQLSIHV